MLLLGITSRLVIPQSNCDRRIRSLYTDLSFYVKEQTMSLTVRSATHTFSKVTTTRSTDISVDRAFEAALEVEVGCTGRVEEA